MKHRLTIQAEDTILDFQKKFNRIYPFLKIEFFEKAHIAKQGSHKKEMIASNMLFRGLIGRGKSHIINFNDDFSISDFEMLLNDQCRLYAQVFRKSGKIWLETSATDYWTLEQQNEEGKSLAKHFKTESENINDIDPY
ncbi:MAG TPA: hypothetical protein PLU85_04060 [Bacteroidia bacterium]|nr:hypothetical protein [Bacteroidia bacterium]OQB59749.1 MAG: hypothetical protein BWX95_02514 [Bacteroidetes bacterium ADurb.Bin141]MBP7713448.1 hypothetical protein [Bacteroidia bacterium]MBP8667290.1 hypothetical protein [Bacteroidia bacterium]HOZ82115.1 hypothetical protein [Bacteroidia bacterium]